MGLEVAGLIGNKTSSASQLEVKLVQWCSESTKFGKIEVWGFLL